MRATFTDRKRGATARDVEVTSAELAEKLNQMVTAEQWQLDELDGVPGFVVKGSFLPLDWDASNRLAKRLLGKGVTLRIATQWNEIEAKWLVAGACEVVLNGEKWELAE